MPESPRKKYDASERSGSISTTLLERVKLREAVAWERFVKLVAPVVFQWCRRWGLQAADAENVVQEVFEYVALRVGEFRREKAGDSFRGWLWSIARRRVLDLFRREKGRPRAIGGTDAQEWLQKIQAEEPSSANGFSAVETDSGVVHRALEAIRGDFTPETFQAFWATAVEDRTSAEVASRLKISGDAVRQAKCRVLRRLREELEGIL